MDTPKSWLKDISLGDGLPKAQGIDFFTKELVPFLISVALFLAFVLSLIFLIVGGIMYMTSGGNKEGMTKARTTITYALIGLVLALLSFIILGIIGQLFDVNLLGTPWVPFCSPQNRAAGNC